MTNSSSLLPPVIHTAKGWWCVETNGFQQSYEHWRNSSATSEFPNTFPYKLSLGWTLTGDLSCLFTPTAHRETRFLSPSHMTTCSIVYCGSARLTKDATEGRCSLGSSVLVRHRDKITTQYGSSLARLFPRKNHLPQAHACTADLGSPGRTPVWGLYGLPFLSRPSVLSTGGLVRLRISSYTPKGVILSRVGADRCGSQK